MKNFIIVDLYSKSVHMWNTDGIQSKLEDIKLCCEPLPHQS